VKNGRAILLERRLVSNLLLPHPHVEMTGGSPTNAPTLAKRQGPEQHQGAARTRHKEKPGLCPGFSSRPDP
jgi:hypothetical protein